MKETFPACLYGPPEMLFERKKAAEQALKRIEVVAAIIRDGDRILATQRGYGRWEISHQGTGSLLKLDNGPR